MNQPSFHCTILFQFLDVPEHLIGSFQVHHTAAGVSTNCNNHRDLDTTLSESQADNLGTDIDGNGCFTYPPDVVLREQIKAYNSSFVQSNTATMGQSPFAGVSTNAQTEEGLETSDDYAIGTDLSLESKKGFTTPAGMRQKQDHWRRIFMNLRKGLKPREYTV